MDPALEHRLAINRREFFSRSVCTIGTAALASLLTRDGLAAAPSANGASPLGGLPGLPHFAPKAKRVIYLFQNGGPTHVELFDFKPRLKEMHGQPVPDAYFAGKRFSTMTGSPQGKQMLAPVEPFAQHGQSGACVRQKTAHPAAVVDDLCFVKSMH